LPRSRRSADSLLTSAWRKRGPLAWPLFPLSLVFAALVSLRRALYRAGLLKSERLPVPVVVVGNISVGGSEKTPLVLYLARQLAQAGFRPGLVSRGYGGTVTAACEVRDTSDPAQVGDEPLLLKRRFGGPTFVGRRRVAAGKALLAAYPDCNLILCDDGLQHYALARDVEIAVIDRRGVMNGWPLPAGPLRETPHRLTGVDALVCNGMPSMTVSGPTLFRMKLQGSRFFRLDQPLQTSESSALAGKRLHAVAGIGDPQRFFDQLASLGLEFEMHPFPDHHRYGGTDLDFIGDAILTTEKDAVKFGRLAKLPVWVLPVEARVEPDLARFLLEKLNGRTPA
jgi:tetraacyldisaccharide 4'-kinase